MGNPLSLAYSMVALALFYLFFIFHCSFSHKEKNLNDLSDAELDRIDKEWNEEEEELDDELRMPPKLKPGTSPRFST